MIFIEFIDLLSKLLFDQFDFFSLQNRLYGTLYRPRVHLVSLSSSLLPDFYLHFLKIKLRSSLLDLESFANKIIEIQI